MRSFQHEVFADFGEPLVQLAALAMQLLTLEAQFLAFAGFGWFVHVAAC
jgi:hypothetical protein